ncbi:hypothetical protein VMCG_03269 [Cytospora schulzeri]|uniref:alpha-galactosidase n=1 Tax=Cytospora schulzeri TaxID=448051 RepID=A0A423WY19_9PEZI|nr:hypothetical protein VMCG_03269 [Valsa malicola]
MLDVAPQRRRNWKKWALALAALLTAIALGLGLGLGLGLKHHKGHHGDGGGGGGGFTPSSNGTNANGTLPMNSAWQIVLSETLTDTDQMSPSNTTNPGVSVYDIDMFLHQNLSVVQDLQKLNITVLCYFSAGSYEPDRPDSWKFKSDDKGNQLDGWRGEYWLDLTSDRVRDIMRNRIDIAAKMGCNGIDPDNVDGYDNDNGLGLSKGDSVDFVRFLAQEASSHGMITGLKNAAAIIDDVIDVVSFSVNEQCVQYDECDDFIAFPQNGKPVFHIEYPAGDEDTDVKIFSPELSPTPLPNKPFILLPLYIYPAPTAWEPLYTAAASHPELDFLVVVNPGNGPGPGNLPDANYMVALTRLAGLQNVRIIGYVHCSYGNRLLDAIVADLNAYRGWTEASAQLGEEKPIIVDGIFIDEVPSSTEFVQYLATLSTAAKILLNRNIAEVNAPPKNNSTEAIAKEAADATPSLPTSTTNTPPPGTISPSNSTAIVIYNPGVVIDPIFYQAADYVVAFENASLQWTSPAVRQQFARLPRVLRERSIAVAHSTAGGADEVGTLGRRCAEMGCPGVFITTQPGYTDWCPFWAEFVRDMARRTMI